MILFESFDLVLFYNNGYVANQYRKNNTYPSIELKDNIIYIEPKLDKDYINFLENILGI